MNKYIRTEIKNFLSPLFAYLQFSPYSAEPTLESMSQASNVHSNIFHCMRPRTYYWGDYTRPSGI